MSNIAVKNLEDCIVHEHLTSACATQGVSTLHNRSEKTRRLTRSSVGDGDVAGVWLILLHPTYLTLNHLKPHSAPSFIHLAMHFLVS